MYICIFVYLLIHLFLCTEDKQQTQNVNLNDANDAFYSFVVFLGAIIFGSDQEVREVMRAIRRNNATGMFSWIGSDGWSARNLVSDGNEPEVIKDLILICGTGSQTFG